MMTQLYGSLNGAASHECEDVSTDLWRVSWGDFKRSLRISPTVTENHLTMRIEPGAAHQLATTAGRHSPPANP